MPIASYCFGDSELQLSHDALKDLKEIKILLLTYGTDSEGLNLQSGCEKFSTSLDHM